MLTDVLKQANDFSYKCRANASAAWFRGHERNSYELKSTLHRHTESALKGVTQPITDDSRSELLRMQYKTIYHRFQGSAWPLLDDRARSEWGMIFTMQHNKVPTRLLDWTESFVCALFFAHRGRTRDEAASVWCLDPESLNQAAIGERPRLIDLNSLAIEVADLFVMQVQANVAEINQQLEDCWLAHAGHPRNAVDACAFNQGSGNGDLFGFAQRVHWIYCSYKKTTKRIIKNRLAL